MAKRTFFVRAIWDPEVKRYYCETDIWGLHIETKTLDEFEEVLLDVAADLIIANHLTKDELATLPLADLVPTIVWQRPQEQAA